MFLDVLLQLDVNDLVLNSEYLVSIQEIIVSHVDNSTRLEGPWGPAQTFILHGE